MANKIQFYAVSQAKFDSITSPSPNNLYFCEDSKRIYKGSVNVTENFFVTEDAVSADTAITGKLYLNPKTFEISFKNSLETSATYEQIVKLSPGYIITKEEFINVANDSKLVTVKSVKDYITDTIDGLEVTIASLNNILSTSITETASDNKIPTEKAVYDAIKSVSDKLSTDIENQKDAFNAVEVKPNTTVGETGSILTFTRQNGNDPVEVKIADLFLSAASYNSETHHLILTVSGTADPVEVDLSELIPQAVSTKDVSVAEKITVTTEVGNFKKGDVIDPASTKDLQTLLVNMLSQDSNPTATQPTASITLSGAGAKEVGTTFNPSYSATLNVGKYTANGVDQVSGVTATAYAVTDSEGATSDTATGTFTAFTVMDNTNYKVNVSITHTAGNIPKTFLGKEYPDAQIQAGTKTASSVAVTGYRQGFYGALTSKTDVVNSDLVRGLTKTNKKVTKGQKYTVNVPAGTLRVIVAYEKTVGAVASITSAEEFGSEIKDSFVLQEVEVNAANGENAKTYNVYVKDLAGAQGTTTTYTVTI